MGDFSDTELQIFMTAMLSTEIQLGNPAHGSEVKLDNL